MKSWLLSLALFLSSVAFSASDHFMIFRINEGTGVWGASTYPVITDVHYVMIWCGDGTYADTSMLPEGWTVNGSQYILYQDPPRGIRPNGNNPPSADYYKGGPFKSVVWVKTLTVPKTDPETWDFPLWNGEDDGPAYKYPPQNLNDARNPQGGFWYPLSLPDAPDDGGGTGGDSGGTEGEGGGGSWTPPAAPDDSTYNPTDGTKDYGPLIRSFREDLLEYLGSKLGTWVYDVKLSNAQLVEMARGQGLKVDASNLPAPVVNVAAPVVNVPAPIVNVPAPVVNVAAPNVTVEAPVVNVPESTLSVDQSITDISEPVLDSEPVPLSDDEQNAIDTVNGWFQSPDEDHTSAIDTIRTFLDSWVGHIPTVGQTEHWFSVHFDLPHVGPIDKELGWDMFPMITTIRSFLVFCVMLFFVFKIVNLVIKVSQ